MPPTGAAYDPLHNEHFENLVYEFHKKHQHCDLIHPSTYEDVKSFLESGSGLRDKQQPFNKDFRAWIRKRSFVLSQGSLQRQVETAPGEYKLLAVVTLPDVGKTIHGLHADLLKHAGQDQTKLKVRQQNKASVW